MSSPSVSSHKRFQMRHQLRTAVSEGANGSPATPPQSPGLHAAASPSTPIAIVGTPSAQPAPGPVSPTSPTSPDFVLDLPAPVSPNQKKQLQGGQFVLVETGSAIGMTHAPYGTILPAEAVRVPRDPTSPNPNSPSTPGRVTLVCRTPPMSPGEAPRLDENLFPTSTSLELPKSPNRPTRETSSESGSTDDLVRAQHAPVLIAPTIYCLVEFKCGRQQVYTSANFVDRGEFVIVDGDRGEDLGLVVNTWLSASAQPDLARRLREQAGEVTEYTGVEDLPTTPAPQSPDTQLRVIRRATESEINRLHHDQASDEQSVVEICQSKVHEHGLNMTVLDAEFQYDRKKLTLYYEAPERQDFRELCKDLYKVYRTRIWFSRVEKGASGGSASPTAPSSPGASHFFQQAAQAHGGGGDRHEGGHHHRSERHHYRSSDRHGDGHHGGSSSSHRGTKHYTGGSSNGSPNRGGYKNSNQSWNNSQNSNPGSPTRGPPAQPTTPTTGGEAAA